jgi:hypothetical protein
MKIDDWSASSTSRMKTMQTRIMNRVYRTGIGYNDYRFRREYTKQESIARQEQRALMRQQQIRQDVIRQEQRQAAQIRLDRADSELATSLKDGLYQSGLGQRYTPYGVLAAMYQKQTATLLSMMA